MRLLMALLLLALPLAGCDPATDLAYLREGPGSQLAWSGLAENGRLQDIYLGYMCDQAGVPVLAQQSYACDYVGFSSRDWALIVQAGMNDIDLRCDEYLAWLDDRRRSAEPILKELAAVAATAEAIMQISGTGAASIAITGVAFGLAANSFTNINSRLLLEIDHATVQSIVLANQNAFRLQIQKQKIDNRPAAIYALRSYLRACMPFTLQTQINNTIVLFERGGPDALKQTSPLIDTRIIGVPILRDVNAPLPQLTQHLPRFHDNDGMGGLESFLSPDRIKSYQTLVGVPATGKLGGPGSETRDRLMRCIAFKDPRPRKDDILTKTDATRLDGIIRENGDTAAKCKA